jgi:hypothetical protein
VRAHSSTAAQEHPSRAARRSLPRALQVWAISNINKQFKKGDFSPPIHATVMKEA